MNTVRDRTTKYTRFVKEFLSTMGHATNAEVHAALQKEYPEVSATTVHRITSRLYDRGELALAPAGFSGTLRYDINNTDHDHFMCEVCGMLRDAMLTKAIKPQIEAAIGDGCSISGSLTVWGVCKKCKEGGK